MEEKEFVAVYVRTGTCVIKANNLEDAEAKAKTLGLEDICWSTETYECTDCYDVEEER